MKHKVILVGTSKGMGSVHIEGVIKHGSEIVALCDCNKETLEYQGEKYNVPADRLYLDWHDTLNLDADIVIIATPDQFHREMSEQYLAAGKNVLCEKPLALTRDDMEAIIAASKKSDKKFMVGQICHFTDAFIKAKKLIDDGKIGEIYYVESEYAHDYDKLFETATWRSDPLRHGVVGGGCHAVDLLRWYAGDPEEVFAYGTHKLLPMVPYDDCTISVLKFPNNVVGKVFVSTGCKRPYTMRTLIYGTKGTIICDNTSDTMELYTLLPNSNIVNETPEIIPVDVNNHNAFGEFSVFADIIDNNKEVEMDAVMGAKTIAACLAIVESSETGKPVKPNYEF